MSCDERLVVWATPELTAGEVIERRDRQHEVWARRIYPGKEDEVVSLSRRIPDACGLGLKVVWNLITVPLERSHEAKLVGLIGAEDHRAETSKSAALIV